MVQPEFLVLIAFSVACGGSSPQADEEMENERGVPGFVQLHEEIFVQSCSSEACHAGAGIAGLSFDDPRVAYDHLVGGTPVNAAAVDAGLALIDPGNPDGSLFLRKLESTQSELTEVGFGGFMPLSAAEVPGPSSIAAIRSWIEAGAPYEGADFEADFVPSPNDGLYVECEATDEDGLRSCFGPEPDAAKTLRLYTPPMVIPAGEELIFCNSLPFIAEADLLFKAVSGAQMRGGHHAGVFVSIQATDDFNPEECGDDMSHLRYTAGAGGAGGQNTVLPPGVSLRISEGQQVVVQSHYINSSDQPVTVMDMVELEYTTLEESPNVVDAFAMIYDDLAIPPGAVGHTQRTTCTLEEDMDIYMLLGHTHEYGVSFEFERIPGGDGEPELLYFATDGKLLRENPEVKVFSEPLKWKAGDELRATCKWDNDTDHTLGWPEEMCVALMYYGPGHGWLTCTQEDGVPMGGAGDGEEGCQELDAPGNALGVGEACTADGDECLDNEQAATCLSQFDDRANFCTFFGCKDDSECGEGASCSDEGAAKVCIPAICL